MPRGMGKPTERAARQGKTEKSRKSSMYARKAGYRGYKGYKGYKIGLCTLCTLHFFDDWNYFKECLSERPQNNGPIRGYVIK